MVNKTVLKYCKLVAKGNASLAKNAGFHGASESNCGDPHELQAKLFLILPWKVAERTASRAGLPVATG